MKTLKIFPYLQRNQPHSRRRLVILRRPDGLFTIADEYHYRTTADDGAVLAEGWARLQTEGIYDDAASAEREVETRISALG
jgi:hypothetical protein